MNSLEYEDGMEKREDIMIHGICERHGRVQAMPKRYIGELEPHWLCPTCGQTLKEVIITSMTFPCCVCGFFSANDLGEGNWVCTRCFRTWERVTMIMSSISRESPDVTDQ